MFDIYFEVALTTLTLIVSAAFLLSIQLFLCFKIQSLFLRLLPVTILGVVGGWFLILSLCISGWDGLGYTVLAIYAGLMLFGCALGWGMWWIYSVRRKRKQHEGE